MADSLTSSLTSADLRRMADGLDAASAAAGSVLALTGESAADIERRHEEAMRATGRPKALQLLPGGVIRLYPASIAHLGVREGDYLLSSEDAPGEVTLVNDDKWWGPGAQ